TNPRDRSIIRATPASPPGGLNLARREAGVAVLFLASILAQSLGRIDWAARIAPTGTRQPHRFQHRLSFQEFRLVI
ncbi:MAG TPA: hypothetical protein VMQ56_12920, partial [Terracidiphilus sp.]|nr:hypothetical protein [Terracidiphilus sp.]